MNTAEKYSFDQRTQEILEHLTIPFAIYQYIDKRVVTVALSRGFCDEFGFRTLKDAYQAMDGDMYRATHPDDKTRIADAAYRFAAFDEPYNVVYRTRTLKDPGYVVLHAFGKSIYPEPGVRLCLTWYAYEGEYSSEEGGYESILNQTLNRFLTVASSYRGMYYDYMTALPNMVYFYELAEAGRKRMRESNTESAVLFFNLTGLKRFNHRYGFAEGDHLIRELADILAAEFSSQNCGRIAQDHFAALAPTDGLEARLSSVIDKCASMNGGRNLPIRIGIYPDCFETVEIGVACDRAKLAADSNKKSEKSYFAVFDTEMMTKEKNRQEIIDNLDRAIEEGWIQVHYQPIVRTINGKVCDCEALARWYDPERGLLMPSAFIPVLEEAGLIHKLDLCVLRQVLKDLKKHGGKCVPVSINFSREDFKVYDLVHEISTMVDKEQVPRNMINIEITESVVGSDVDYIREQMDRFRSQGFQVWMDDFGSGYSSLEVLQTLKFDLIKFDMGFLRRLDEGEEGKIILTEMMKMASSLGVDTVCEGVEKEDHIHFLQEIGCSKLQGYFFMKPSPPERIYEKYTSEIRDGLEDRRVTSYFEAVGKETLFDLSFLADADGTVLKHSYNTVPMGIMEIDRKSDSAEILRSNRGYRDFLRSLSETQDGKENTGETADGGKIVPRLIRKYRAFKNKENRRFVDEELEDGRTVHAFVRRIGVNPVNGNEAVAIAVLSVTEPDESTTYADIANSLAADYYNIYLIDLDTNDYIEYTSRIGGDEMTLVRHGGDFFESARRDTMTRIYEPDRAPFLEIFTRENVLRDVDTLGGFTTTYRLIDTGTPMYVNMKITRMKNGNRLILGVSIVDAHVKEKQSYLELRNERALLLSVMSLDVETLSLFTVNLETGEYTEYRSSEVFDSLGAAKAGSDFFRQSEVDTFLYIDEPDRERFLEQFTRENVLRVIRKEGVFRIDYHLVLEGRSRPVTLKATLFKEGETDKLVVSVRAREGWKE